MFLGICTIFLEKQKRKGELEKYYRHVLISSAH